MFVCGPLSFLCCFVPWQQYLHISLHFVINGFHWQPDVNCTDRLSLWMVFECVALAVYCRWNVSWNVYFPYLERSAFPVDKHYVMNCCINATKAINQIKTTQIQWNFRKAVTIRLKQFYSLNNVAGANKSPRMPEEILIHPGHDNQGIQLKSVTGFVVVVWRCFTFHSKYWGLMACIYIPAKQNYWVRLDLEGRISLSQSKIKDNNYALGLWLVGRASIHLFSSLQQLLKSSFSVLKTVQQKL